MPFEQVGVVWGGKGEVALHAPISVLCVWADLSRCTILCKTVSDVLNVMKYLLGEVPSDERKPDRFQACRVKDRLSRAWDAEVSGGNRDLLINGWLDLGGRKYHIVEVQVHLEPLYALKHDLHVLYAGARVLGAMDDLAIAWEGELGMEKQTVESESRSRTEKALRACQDLLDDKERPVQKDPAARDDPEVAHLTLTPSARAAPLPSTFNASPTPSTLTETTRSLQRSCQAAWPTLVTVLLISPPHSSAGVAKVRRRANKTHKCPAEE